MSERVTTRSRKALLEVGNVSVDVDVHVESEKDATGNGIDADEDKMDTDSETEAIEAPSMISPSDYASMDDEPPLLLHLDGRNEVPFVQMWGWSNSTPLSFPCLKENLCMQKVFYPDGGDGEKMPAELEDAINNEERDKLSRLGRTIYSDYYVDVKQHIVVQVVAKKKPDAIMMRGRGVSDDKPATCFVIGNLVVADDTGACLISCMNESTAIIQEKVSVGDFLIIKKCSAKQVNLGQCKFHYPYHEKLLNLEIKIEKYSVRHVQHIPFRGHVKWKPTMWPSFLLRDHKKSMLWTPSTLPTSPMLKDAEKKVAEEPVQYFDIAGVVNHVGRMERLSNYNRANAVFADTYEGGDYRKVLQHGEKRFFYVHRWISIVDGSSKPLPVKLLMTPDTMHLQKDVVPGAIIVITNCKQLCSEIDDIGATVCSQIYLNGDVNHYSRLMPPRYAKILLKIISGESYKDVLQRKDIKWTAGGSRIIPISKPSEFVNEYEELLEKSKTDVDLNRSIKKLSLPRDYNFAKREIVPIVFKGKILYVYARRAKDCETHINPHQVPVNGSKKIIWMKPLVNGYEYKHDNSIPQPDWSHHNSCLCSKCKLCNWFQYCHEVEMKIPQSKTPSSSKHLNKVVTDRMKPFCGALLMPAIYDDGSCLANLPISGSLDHYRIILQDINTGTTYDAKWDLYSMSEMKRKYREAINKTVVAEVCIFSSESVAKKEVILRGFVVEKVEEGVSRDKTDNSTNSEGSNTDMDTC